MIVNNTNDLQQIYECVKDYEYVDKISSLIKKDINEYVGNVTSIRNYAFNHCTSLISIDLPNATSIGDYAFGYCTSLISIDLPNATIIGNSAFSHCTALTSIDLPSATSIGGYAFSNCDSLTFIDLHNATSIDDRAFNDCYALTILIIRTNSVCILGTYALFDASISSGTGYIYVPSSLLDQYKTAENWSKYASQFRALEDYTIDGTTTGELDPSKI